MEKLKNSKMIEDWKREIQSIQFRIENYEKPKGLIETFISSKKYSGFELSIYQIWKNNHTTGNIRLEVKSVLNGNVDNSDKWVYTIRVEEQDYFNKKKRYCFMDELEPFYVEEGKYLDTEKFFSEFKWKVWCGSLYNELEQWLNKN
jgi:hypothetical protein